MTEPIWSERQALASPGTQPWPRAFWAAEAQPRPSHRRGPGGPKARLAFQNRPPTGARVPSRTGASFARRKRPDSCFLDLVILPSGPERSHLPLGDSFPLEGRRPGQAKAGFCTPEHPLGGPVKPQKGPARKQDQGSIGPPRRCPSRGTGGAEVGSRPGWLSSAIPHWACVPP